jgi:GT2 family glycosyltransferase
MSALVTILIATKDRPDDLRRTLQQLRGQDYPNTELLVIDDGSNPRLESIVFEESPQATYVYQHPSAGQSRRRSEGFEMAKGEYILQLDDDSFPVHPEGLSEAVKTMQARSEIGILSFYVFNGEHLPEALPVLPAKYHSSFIGCGALVRSAAVARIGGYCDFFGNEWEEEELSLRMLKAGWAIYFKPQVLIHHVISPRNRLTTRTWMRGFRNKLWAIVMHFPASRLPLEMTWVLAIAAFDAVRLVRFRAFARGIVEFFGGLPRAVRLRDPMSSLVLRRYDAMRFGVLETEEAFKDPPKVRIRDLAVWYRAWLNRPRQRSFWDRRPGDTGTSPTVKYAHEYKVRGDVPRNP